MDSLNVAEAVRDTTRLSPRLPRPRAGAAAEVRDGLFRRQRELPTRFLADSAIAHVRRGVEVQFCERLQEAEAPLIREWSRSNATSHEWRRVVELIPGGSRSALELIDLAADRAPIGCYLAVDSTLDPATEGAERVANRSPDVVALPMVSDLTLPLPVRRTPHTLFAVLGGALGRFTPLAAIRVLRSLRSAMTMQDRLLVGLDLRPASVRVIDTTSATMRLTEWHRHVLSVTNREVGTDFVPAHFRYRARIDSDDRRVDEGLECLTPTRITSPIMTPIALRRGDFIRTAAQHTYDGTMLNSMLRGVGLALEQWSESSDGAHALATAMVRLQDDVQS